MMPRERYLLTGPDAAGHEDLLALVIGTGAGGRSARSIAGDLLERFGGLPGIVNASPNAIAEVRGVGPARAARIHAGMVLGQRARVDARLDDKPIQNAAAAARWFLPALEGLDHEELHALYLDRRARPIGYRRVSVGCDRFTIVDPRQILRPAVELGASSLVVAHNHPSGEPEPSPEDIRATQALSAAAKILGLQLLDHLVVAGVGWTSLQLRMVD